MGHGSVAVGWVQKLSISKRSELASLAASSSTMACDLEGLRGWNTCRDSRGAVSSSSWTTLRGFAGIVAMAERKVKLSFDGLLDWFMAGWIWNSLWDFKSLLDDDVGGDALWLKEPLWIWLGERVVWGCGGEVLGFAEFFFVFALTCTDFLSLQGHFLLKSQMGFDREVLSLCVRLEEVWGGFRTEIGFFWGWWNSKPALLFRVGLDEEGDGVVGVATWNEWAL